MTDTDTQLSSTQLSSYSDSSSTTLQHPVAPNYVSARSADVILSEVRPTRMKSEALRSLNVLLDELLWLILGSARSFSTERLKIGLIRVLPTVLGKNALLEAEVELRAYQERNPSTPIQVDDFSAQKFPFQPAFELLRMKCEAYSSLGDQEENSDLENVLYSRMIKTVKDITISHSSLAPAALYLTAILEHICEHILSNVGRVVARDSSRTTAHSSDLYTALCEDESIYSLFKTMKVQDQIEQQSGVVNPKLSKSPSRNDVGIDRRVGSPDPPNTSKPRQSVDSAVSTSSTGLAGRLSVDKNKSKGLFKTPLPEHKTSGDNLRRSNSLIGDHASGYNQDETINSDDSIQDFDILMRSGNTMKVSLTPDRLKTFEVYSKEKNLRTSKPGPQSHPRDTNPPQPFVAPTTSQQPKAATRLRSQVEAIVEIPETELGRSRSASASGLTPNSTRPNTPRTRSYTEVQAAALKPFDYQGDTRTRGVLTQGAIMPTAVPSIDPPGIPKKNRRTLARHRESLDLDDIMDGSDDELPPQPKKPSLTPKSAQATSGETRDLLEFLSEGPPEPISPPASTSSTTFLDGKSSKSGRFRNIVSRLTGNNTTREEFVDGVIRSPINTRPPAPLHTKRSIPNVSARAALLQTSFSQDTPVSPTRAHYIPGSRRPSDWERTKESAEVASKRPHEYTNPKSPPRSLNGREAEQSYPSTPRKPVPAFNISNITAVESPSSINEPQQGAVVTSPVTPKPELASFSPVIPVHFQTPNFNGTSPLIREEEIRDFQKHIARAETVEECRVLAELLLSKCHLLPKDDPKQAVAEDTDPCVAHSDDAETLVVELLLGDSDYPDFHLSPAHLIPSQPVPNGALSS